MFFNRSATTAIYTPSLHDALPILREHLTSPPFPLPIRSPSDGEGNGGGAGTRAHLTPIPSPSDGEGEDRKSTRLNSSHLGISYAVFCFKKKTASNKLAPPTCLMSR